MEIDQSFLDLAWYLVAGAGVLLFLVIALWIVRAFMSTGGAVMLTKRNKRLGVVDQASVDGRRRLVLVRVLIVRLPFGRRRRLLLLLIVRVALGRRLLLIRILILVLGRRLLLVLVLVLILLLLLILLVLLLVLLILLVLLRRRRLVLEVFQLLADELQVALGAGVSGVEFQS